MNISKLLFLLGFAPISISPVLADDSYILCPTGDQITFKQNDEKWKATAEFDDYNFIGSLAIKTGVTPSPSEDGTPISGRVEGPNFNLACLYRVKNQNSALTLKTSFTNPHFSWCMLWHGLGQSGHVGYRCETVA